MTVELLISQDVRTRFSWYPPSSQTPGRIIVPRPQEDYSPQIPGTPRSLRHYIVYLNLRACEPKIWIERLLNDIPKVVQ